MTHSVEGRCCGKARCCLVLMFMVVMMMLVLMVVMMVIVMMVLMVVMMLLALLLEDDTSLSKVVPGSVAEKQGGILPNDQVIEVDGLPLSGYCNQVLFMMIIMLIMGIIFTTSLLVVTKIAKASLYTYQKYRHLNFNYKQL